MGRKTIDRTGEENYNTFGSKMIIIDYRRYNDIDVYFPEYDWTYKGAEYGTFEKGQIRCPYEPRVHGVGYIGEGKYKTKENNKHTKCYDAWKDMLRRCYSEEFHEKEPTYKNCSVDDNWLNFQNFAKWYENNYYEIVGERMHLDKDILIKGNRIYSSNTCVYVPQVINTLFIKCDNKRGNYPVGVYYNKRYKKFIAYCNVYDILNGKSYQERLGYYESPEEAFKAYKQFKEKYIKQVADLYKDKIPSKLYDAMYKYEIEITD